MDTMEYSIDFEIQFSYFTGTTSTISKLLYIKLEEIICYCTQSGAREFVTCHTVLGAIPSVAYTMLICLNRTSIKLAIA